MHRNTNHRRTDHQATTPTPAVRREGSVMGAMRNPKRLLIAAVTIAGLTGGAMVAHADPFRSRAYENTTTTGDVLVPQNLSVSPAPAWPSIPSTCTLADRDADTCAVTLTAAASSVDVTDHGATVSVPFWGFGVNTPNVALAGAEGSIIKVPEGTTIHVTLDQQAGTGGPIDLSFPSLPNVTKTGALTYDVVADKVGTMLFEPGSLSGSTGLDAPRQVAMGMVGVLIVTPVSPAVAEVPATDTTPAVPAVPAADCGSCAYDAATPYADEALVALSTLDPGFAADPSQLSYFGQPRDAEGNTRTVYHLINGKAFPDTDVIDVREGDSLLLRYVNAGLDDRNMGLLGLRQEVLATNATEYVDPQTLVAPRVGPGETVDAVVHVPTGVAEGQKYSLMDQSREFNGATGDGFGGALTFVDVWVGTLPVVDGQLYDFGTQTLTALAHPSDAARTITGYQTLVTDTDVAPADGDWATATTVTLAPVPAVGADAPISGPVTATGGQYVWVRAQQDSGIWSAPVSVQAVAPLAAPTVSIDSIDTSSARTVTITATAVEPGATIATVEAGFGDTNGPVDWTAPVTGTYIVSGADHHGEEVWVRATDSNGTVSIAVHATIPLDTPTVSAVAYDLTTGTLSATGTVDAAPMASPATWQWVDSATTPDGTTVWTAGTGDAINISSVLSLATGEHDIWVQVLDAKGNSSVLPAAPLHVSVP